MLMILGGCGTLSNDGNTDLGLGNEGSKYVFHDDFYYDPTKEDGKCDLEKTHDEYFVSIDAEKEEMVLAELADEGFQIIYGPITKSFQSYDYEIPDFCKNNKILCVKGSGDITSIQNLVFYNNLYNDEYGLSQVGKSNAFHVRCSKNRIDLVLQYAEQHKVYPVTYVPEYEMFYLLCTSDSAGNPVEMSNWFIEEAGFEYAMPNYVEIGFD